jgi:ABC-type transport system involved in cytochrome c biogenesis permease subunit
VAHQGRIKPIDTLARNTLRALTINSETAKVPSGKQDDKTVKIPATKWFLEVISGTDASTEMAVIRIDSAEVRKIFDLPTRKGFLYSVKELQPGIGRFEKQVQAAEKLPAEEQTVEQRRILELDQRLKLYISLVRSFSPPDLPRMPTEQTPQAAAAFVQDFKLALMRSREEMDVMKAPRPIPLPLKEGEERAAAEDAWQPYPVAWALAYVQHQMLGQEPDPGTLALEQMMRAYEKGEAGNFNRELLNYEAHLKRTAPPLYHAKKVDLEARFNRVSPFFVGMPLYVIAFVMAIFGWLLRYKPLNWGAFTLILLTFLLHSGALALRIYISGRPPVTNLYSSAVFIGWAVVLAGLAIEAIYRLGLGNIVAAIAGYATLQIAYFLSSGGDTITVLQAVLDTQFWLATHVVCITLGYAATYLAGLLGVLYVCFGLFTPFLAADMRKDLGRMIYGVTCFAILFSFFGTVLGGLWADDSWGRFWGWDPKENGALIIVLWNALMLHARWDKMVGERGLAVLAIGGNIATSWSWFGVNHLGIGLHAYGGFEGTVVLALLVFVGSQLLLIGAGCIPTRYWLSFQADEGRSAGKAALEAAG